MQPEVNPNYFRYQYPNYMPNYQSQNAPIYPYGQTAPQNSFYGIAGKTVNDFNEINANDVPMDGRVAIFPKGDLSEIAVKNWESNGTIRTTVFKPILPQEGSNGMSETFKGEYGAFGEVLKGIQDDIKMLTEKIDKIGKPSKAKKETEDD